MYVFTENEQLFMMTLKTTIKQEAGIALYTRCGEASLYPNVLK